MEHTNMLVKASPHIRDNSSTQKIMLDVIIALCPAIVASGIIFGWRALLVIGVTAAASVAFEYLYCYLMKKPITISDLSAVVTGILLAFNLPSTIPLWIAILGSFVAVVIAKQMFGGLGHNFATPAIVGRIVLAVSFAGRMTAYAYPAVPGGVDALAGATPLVATQHADLPLLQLFLGAHGGVLGETCAAALLLGGVYLVARRVISPAIPVTYLATVALVSLLAGQEPLVQLLSGGLMLGAIFMATDYVTSPYTLTGKLVYGVGLGVITCAIRFWASSTEGVSYAILLMNLFVPYINDLTRQKPLGGAKKK